MGSNPIIGSIFFETQFNRHRLVRKTAWDRAVQTTTASP